MLSRNHIHEVLLAWSIVEITTKKLLLRSYIHLSLGRLFPLHFFSVYPLQCDSKKKTWNVHTSTLYYVVDVVQNISRREVALQLFRILFDFLNCYSIAMKTERTFFFLKQIFRVQILFRAAI